jgi:hypothetical protein
MALQTAGRMVGEANAGAINDAHMRCKPTLVIAGSVGEDREYPRRYGDR